MSAETTTLHRPAEEAKGTSVARWCFILLAACVPASMLLILQPPDSLLAYLAQHRGLWSFYKSIAPAYPDWLEYFAVQTLATPIAVCAFYILLTRRGRLERRHVFALLVGAYALWTALSYLWSVWPYGTRAYVIQQLPFYLLAAVAALVCTTERRVFIYALLFLAAALVQAAVTVVVLASAVHSHPGWSFARAFLENPLFFQNKNFSCALMLTAGYAAVGLALREALARRRAALGVAAGLVAVGLLGCVFVAAGALAGWVALGVSAPAYALCVLPVRRKGLIVTAAGAVGLAACLVVLLAAPLRERVRHWALNPKGTAGVRVMSWEAGAVAFADRRVGGWGAGTWAAVFPRFQPPLASLLPQTATTRAEHPHNEFVRAASDTGIVGLGLYAALLLWAFLTSWRALQDRPPQERLIGGALWAGALAFFVQTLFGKAPAGWSFAANYWMLLGVLAGTAWWRDEAPPAPPRRMPDWGWAALAVVAVAVAYGWWSWGVGSYRSMVALRRTEEANQWIAAHLDKRAVGLAALQKAVDQARPRSLQAPSIMYYDYVIGGTMVALAEWQEGARYLQEHVDRWAPGFQKTDLMLAACFAHAGNVKEAAARAERYARQKPYKAEGYAFLARYDPALAASLLHEQLYKREGFNDPDKVLELLELYALRGEWEQVGTVVRDASRAAGLIPDGVVRMLADRLRKQGQRQALDGLEAHFPSAFARPQKQQGPPAGNP